MFILLKKSKQRVGRTTHFDTHQLNIYDLEVKNNAFYSFNPFVVGSTPAGPTKNLKKDLDLSKSFFLALWVLNWPYDLSYVN